MSRRVDTAMALVALAAVAACDKVGTATSNGRAVPQVAPPRLYPVTILPPKVDRTTINRVVLKDPPAIAFTQIDVFKQGNGVVDILWVVDDSGSMQSKRARLGNDFGAFMQVLLSVGSNFQIGVTSTNPANAGALVGTTRIITNQTANPVSTFVANTTFPQSRVKWSEGLRTGELALLPPNTTTGSNQGFLRPNAALGVIIVSDADDQGYGDPAYYARFFKGLKGAGNENLVTVSTIAGTLPSGCYGPGDQVYYGSLSEPAFRYDAVAQLTQGVIASICDASFVGSLTAIAEAINTLRRVFALTLKPDATTLTVTVNGQPVPQDEINGWTYDPTTNSIEFKGNYVPPPGASIQVTYAIG